MFLQNSINLSVEVHELSRKQREKTLTKTILSSLPQTVMIMMSNRNIIHRAKLSLANMHFSDAITVNDYQN